ncbi:glycosyltransferase family 1 protein [Nocardioides nanhaiensis]|uniref:Glycosyltransferase family 1 protein n=1 Tax=Nocardioides nanhaiensis TaxID=1476871 RepID=A0ABP8VWC1_9ACTN
MTVTQRPPAPASTLLVASVPTGHVYVRHLADDRGDVVRRLPDPAPRGSSAGTAAATGAWWPPRVLDLDWVAGADVDLVHLHFGFDAVDPAHLERWVAALRRRGLPLVFTVHDLRNPHHADRSAHDRQLDVLVPAADALLTLTTGAAAEIERRWGVQPVVVPHPHVVPLATLAAREQKPAAREEDDRPFTVGVHLKSLRASMDPWRVLPVLVETVASLPHAVLRVDVHHDVMGATGPRHDAALTAWLREEERAGLLQLHVHDYFTDEQLWRYLAGLDLAVLPYRFGTHSGWLEACRDLGTTVAAPTCGYFTDQGPVLAYTADEHHLDAASLRAAVETAHRDRPRLGASLDERLQQRRELAARHTQVYRAVREGA